MARFRGCLALLSSAAFLVGAAKAQIPEEDVWRPWSGTQSREKTDDKLRSEGRKRAEAEYHDGWAEIEIFGLWLGSVYVDEEVGLYRRLRGCAIVNRADVESEAYNERIKELVAADGPPQKARGLKERFDQLRKLMERKPGFVWVPVTWSKNNAKPVPTKVGPFEVVAEVIPNPVGAEVVRGMLETGIDFPRIVSRIRIGHAGETLATVDVEEGRVLAATMLPELEVLIIKDTGRVDWLTFIDTRHGRVMWRYPGLKDILKDMLDETRPPSLSFFRTPCQQTIYEFTPSTPRLSSSERNRGCRRP